MRPPTRIRDDAPSAHARELLDAARPVRAMTAAERAASAARLARIGAAPAAAHATLWGKSLADPRPGTPVYGLAPCVVAAATAASSMSLRTRARCAACR